MDIRDLLKAINKGGIGERKAIEMLHKQYAVYVRQKVSGYFYGKAIDQDIVNDVSQEVWIKIFKNVKTYKIKNSEHEEHSFLSWLKTTSIRTCIDTDRSRKRKNENADNDGDFNELTAEEEPVAIAELENIEDTKVNVFSSVSMEQCIDHAMLEFESKHEKCYRLIRAVAWEKLTTKELSKLLGIKEGAARQFLAYCRSKLRPFTNPCLDAN